MSTRREFVQLPPAVVVFDPRFEIMPGTAARSAQGRATADKVAITEDYEAIPRQTIAE